jgi:hypothetical protein
MSEPRSKHLVQRQVHLVVPVARRRVAVVADRPSQRERLAAEGFGRSIDADQHQVRNHHRARIWRIDRSQIDQPRVVVLVALEDLPVSVRPDAQIERAGDVGRDLHGRRSGVGTASGQRAGAHNAAQMRVVAVAQHVVRREVDAVAPTERVGLAAAGILRRSTGRSPSRLP